jgi:hypothetical protein
MPGHFPAPYPPLLRIERSTLLPNQPNLLMRRDLNINAEGWGRSYSNPAFRTPDGLDSDKPG